MRTSQFGFVLAAMLMIAAAATAAETKSTYTVASGAASAPILIPATNTPVSLTCANTTVGYRGVGQATILRTAVQQPLFLEWVGMDIGTSAISSGFSNTLGTHIIYCSYVDQYVDIQVQDQNHIRVVNTSGTTMSGVITFTY